MTNWTEVENEVKQYVRDNDFRHAFIVVPGIGSILEQSLEEVKAVCETPETRKRATRMHDRQIKAEIITFVKLKITRRLLAVAQSL